MMHARCLLVPELDPTSTTQETHMCIMKLRCLQCQLEPDERMTVAARDGSDADEHSRAETNLTRSNLAGTSKANSQGPQTFVTHDYRENILQTNIASTQAARTHALHAHTGGANNQRSRAEHQPTSRNHSHHMIAQQAGSHCLAHLHDSLQVSAHSFPLVAQPFSNLATYVLPFCP